MPAAPMDALTDDSMCVRNARIEKRRRALDSAADERVDRSCSVTAALRQKEAEHRGAGDATEGRS